MKKSQKKKVATKKTAQKKSDKPAVSNKGEEAKKPQGMDQVAQARQILGMEHQKKMNEFAAKLNALCTEYKVDIRANATLAVVPRGEGQ